jgi:hypothetical protein
MQFFKYLNENHITYKILYMKYDIMLPVGSNYSSWDLNLGVLRLKLIVSFDLTVR